MILINFQKYLFLCLLVLLLPSACKNDESTNETDFNLYQPSVTYPVELINGYQVKDPNRSNRTFSILGRKPTGAAMPYPLIIFSHGGDSDDNGHLHNDEWGNQLARAGYFVIHIAHAESPLGCTYCDQVGIKSDEREVADFMKPVSEGGTLPEGIYDRPRDVVAVLNDLDNIEKAGNIKFDRNKIGVAGHSAGAYTTMTSAGAAVDCSPTLKDLVVNEPRIKAFLALSPPGVGSLGLDARSWDNLNRPMMTVTGPNDVGGLVTNPTERLDAYKYSPSPDKYQLYINHPGTIHKMFGLSAVEGINTLNELENIVLASGLAFLDAYIKNNDQAKNWLKSDGLSQFMGGIAQISRK